MKFAILFSLFLCISAFDFDTDNVLPGSDVASETVTKSFEVPLESIQIVAKSTTTTTAPQVFEERTTTAATTAKTTTTKKEAANETRREASTFNQTTEGQSIGLVEKIEQLTTSTTIPQDFGKK